LWTWGLNSHGQCGTQNQPTEAAFAFGSASGEVISEPVQPFLENDINTKISYVACGGKHSLALASANVVYSWGNNQYG